MRSTPSATSAGSASGLRPEPPAARQARRHRDGTPSLPGSTRRCELAGMSPRANDEFRRAMTERAEQQARGEEAAEERLADMRATIEHLRREREARLAEFHALTHPKATPTPPAERPMVEAVAAAEPAPRHRWCRPGMRLTRQRPRRPRRRRRLQRLPRPDPTWLRNRSMGPASPAGVSNIASDEASGPEPPADPDDIALPWGWTMSSSTRYRW